MRFSFLALLVVVTLPFPLRARADDAPNAVDELKTGYALKQAGKCPEAIPHFLASYLADPKPKALLNLVDCKQQTGDLVAARGYAQQGRDLAAQQNDAELVGVADQQLAAIDKRLARLTIRLASHAPADSRVSRDSIVLDQRSLGVAVEVNPGAHRIVVAAVGRTDAEFDVTLAEGAVQELEVHPGGPLAQEPTAAIAGHPRTEEVEMSSERAPSPSTRTLLTYGAFGVGAVGLAVGLATGIAATSKHSALERECPNASGCPDSAQNDIDSFHSLRTWSTVGYVVGAAGLATGAVLWFTAPKASPELSARLWIGPRSAGVAGAF